jgi:hypothetical protein
MMLHAYNMLLKTTISYRLVHTWLHEAEGPDTIHLGKFDPIYYSDIHHTLSLLQTDSQVNRHTICILPNQIPYSVPKKATLQGNWCDLDWFSIVMVVANTENILEKQIKVILYLVKNGNNLPKFKHSIDHYFFSHTCKPKNI